MTQERKRIRAELQALIEIETDPAKWIAMKDFLEALDDVDDFEQAQRWRADATRAGGHRAR